MTGWSWDAALDGLTVPRFLALRAEWRQRPPAHWLIAAALNYKAPQETQRPQQPSVAELQTLLS